MLLATATVFVIGNLVAALGAGYNIIMVGRVISAMAHGAFLGIAAVFAADLVPAQMKGRAIAMVFAGLTASTVLGAPIGAAIGRALGWRATFWSLVVLGLVTLVGLIVMLPRRARAAQSAHAEHTEHGGHVAHAHHNEHRTVAEHGAHAEHGTNAEHGAHLAHSEHVSHAEHEALVEHGAHGVSASDLEGLDAHALAHLGGAGQAAPLGQQLQALRRRSVWVSLLMTLLSYGGVFTSYVYLAPQLTEVAGFDATWVTPLFLLFGVGLFIGNSIGGRLADRYGIAAVAGTVGALVLALFGMTFAIQSQLTAIIGLLLYGIAAFAVVAPLQLRVMAEAGDAPDIASAANISAFTLGSALGIWLGGAAIDGGLGLAAVNWVGGLISLAGLALALISWRWLERGQPESHAGHHAAHHAGHHA
jgi:predicted MFS family arabinose efflux permease